HLLLHRHAGFVRRLPYYYGGVRLLTPVHHWLRLLAFPMRAAVSSRRSDVRSPRFQRDPFERDGVLDLGRAAAPRIAGTFMLPSTTATVSASANRFSWLNGPPLSIAVYASRPPSPTGSRNTRYQAGRYSFTCAGLPPAGSRQLCLAHRSLRYPYFPRCRTPF